MTLEVEGARSVLTQYDLGTVEGIEPVPSGLIHQTFRVDSTRGRYALQRLHPRLATEEILSDYQVVTTHLAAHHFPAPRLLPNQQGQKAPADEKGARWRLISWLDGQSHDALQSPQMAREAAALLARFHRTMSSLSYSFRSQHPLHQTEYHLAALQQARQRHQGSDLEKTIAHNANQIEDALPSLLLPPLPQRVVHGDPKISNVLFDSQQHAIALIDLDTCTHHSLLVDLGDAIRSWCRAGGEDEEQPLLVERFAALLQGYASECLPLQPNEIACLPRAGRLITLELASRFLTDYLDDSYFGWNPQRFPSRRKHNLARAKGMLFLAQQMEQLEPTLRQIVNELAPQLQYPSPPKGEG